MHLLSKHFIYLVAMSLVLFMSPAWVRADANRPPGVQASDYQKYQQWFSEAAQSQSNAWLGLQQAQAQYDQAADRYMEMHDQVAIQADKVDALNEAQEKAHDDWQNHGGSIDAWIKLADAHTEAKLELMRMERELDKLAAELDLIFYTILMPAEKRLADAEAWLATTFELVQEAHRLGAAPNTTSYADQFTVADNPDYCWLLQIQETWNLGQIPGSSLLGGCLR
jgi:hypothetical protein